MDQDESYESLKRRRKYEERRLIEELKYKRSCVRLAPTLPTENDVQRKIRHFIREIIRITKTNTLQDDFTKVQGNRPVHYARGEATLYRGLVENIWLRTSQTRERLRSAAEALAMSHETYKFLILAETATEESRNKFYDDDVQGISIDPVFTSDYIRKEIEFLDEILKCMENEMKHAEIQIGNEDHKNGFTELKEAVAGLQKSMEASIAGLQRSMEASIADLQEEISKQDARITELVNKMDGFGEDVQKVKDCVQCRRETKESDQTETLPTQNEESEDQHSDAPEKPTDAKEGLKAPPSDGEIVEDLLDLDYEGDYQMDNDMNTDDHPTTAPQRDEVHLEVEQTRRRLLSQLQDLRRTQYRNKRVPRRIFTFFDIMRDRSPPHCSFCRVKGKHYSDSCPLFKEVGVRERKIWCRNCLDTLFY
ncbi:hypothetical protein OSTOST_08561 [Ostertagia ostertagi]